MEQVKAEPVACPFCGGEAELQEWVGNGFTLPRVTWGKVGCPSCQIWTREIQPSGGYKSSYNHDRAIAAWNQRANPQPAAALRAIGDTHDD